MLMKLLEQTRSYLVGEITLRELENWLITNLQTILDSGDEKAFVIVNELDADLVEFGEGIILTGGKLKQQ